MCVHMSVCLCTLLYARNSVCTCMLSCASEACTLQNTGRRRMGQTSWALVVRNGHAHTRKPIIYFPSLPYAHQSAPYTHFCWEVRSLSSCHPPSLPRRFHVQYSVLGAGVQSLKQVLKLTLSIELVLILNQLFLSSHPPPPPPFSSIYTPLHDQWRTQAADGATRGELELFTVNLNKTKS